MQFKVIELEDLGTEPYSQILLALKAFVVSVFVQTSHNMESLAH